MYTWPLDVYAGDSSSTQPQPAAGDPAGRVSPPPAGLSKEGSTRSARVSPGHLQPCAPQQHVRDLAVSSGAHIDPLQLSQARRLRDTTKFNQ